ncbi:hypothetical protein [Streptomyces bacillaris]|uniref:hypothetical protein n=1 Tax=Streptomyces bacillaris TaxID=68179 RepID=UPI003D72126B
MTSAARPTSRRYPHAGRQDLVEELHGLPLPDPYRWLEDAHTPATRRWSDEQQALYEAERAQWPGLRCWEEQVAALTAVDRASPPRSRGARLFWLQQDAGQEHPVLMVRDPGPGGAERVLLDPHALDPSGRTVLDAWQPSLEGDLLACQLSRNGTENSELSVIDVATGKTVDGPVDRVRKSSLGWLPGGRAFYYVRPLDPRLNPGEQRYHRRVWLHRLGTAPHTDVLVFGEGRERTQFYSVAVTADGRWLAVRASPGTGRRSDVYLADLTAGPPERPLLYPVQEGLPAASRLHGVPGTGLQDVLWLRTDHGAPRGRVVAVRPADLHLGPRCVA